MNIEWKTIPNFSKYSCNKLGKIRNNATYKVLKNAIAISGYRTNTLENNLGKHVHRGTHRFIAETWIVNPENKPTVNHINKIRDDNRVENLEWMTHKEQSVHKNKTRKNITVNNSKGLWKCNKYTGIKIKYYRTFKDAAMELLNFKKIDIEPNKKIIRNTSISINYNMKKNNIYKDFLWKIAPRNIYFKNSDMDNEEWKLIKSINKHNYYVSNYARIRNNNRLLKPHLHHGGYYWVTIYDKSYVFHRIIAKHFVKNNNKINKIVNHIDGNKSNNIHSNLEWCTNSHNIKEAIKIGLRTTLKKIINYNPNNNNILGIYDSSSHAGRQLNVNISSVGKCCKGIIKSCGVEKLKFKYLELSDDLKTKTIDPTTIIIKKTKSTNNPGRKIRKIAVYNKDNELLDVCKNQLEVVKKYNICRKTVRKHCETGKMNPVNGFRFKYHETLDEVS